jgi:hypothetical protein
LGNQKKLGYNSGKGKLVAELKISVRYIGRVAACMSFCCLIANAASAQEASGTLDALWEEDAKTTSSASQNTDLSAAAPLCTVDDFKKSSLMVEGGWPEVGPFKSQSENENEFADVHNNKLKIQVLDGQVEQAQLNIATQKPAARELLDVQLNTDFLLESLGAKASSIALFNKMISNEQGQVWTRTHPLQVAAGHYLVSIRKKPIGQDKQSGYSIQVNSQDPSPRALKEQASGSIASTSNSSNSSNQAVTDATQIASAIPTLKPELPEPTATPTNVSSANSKSGTEPDAASKSTAKSTDPLKDSFTECIYKWQGIKKKAVKLKQSSQLASVLGGKALLRQTEAIKWLATNQESCDLTAKLVSFDRYTPVIPAKKYTVQATVREQSKYTDDKSAGHVLKEDDSTYKVSYTMEKVKDQWLITDYSVIGSTHAK